jgi:catechol 2,3-dioxygenase-like lactoylglutathione lyase family enzyme
MTTPHINCEQHHVILSVSDVRASADFYTKKLGLTLAFTEGDRPTFAGVNLGQVQVFLETSPNLSSAIEEEKRESLKDLTSPHRLVL